MNDPIIAAIESVQAQLTAETGIAFGTKLSAADATIAQRGDPLLALGYASLFFPTIHLREGVPFASFATQSKPTPIDCVHVNLLHHHGSRCNSESTYAALGMVLAEAWNSVLHRNGVAGRFKYDQVIEPVVIYEQPAQSCK
jgi:hypothetical protein